MNTQITNNETMRIGTAEMLNHIKEKIDFYQECIYRGCGDRESYLIVQRLINELQDLESWIWTELLFPLGVYTVEEIPNK